MQMMSAPRMDPPESQQASVSSSEEVAVSANGSIRTKSLESRHQISPPHPFSPNLYRKRRQKHNRQHPSLSNQALCLRLFNPPSRQESSLQSPTISQFEATIPSTKITIRPISPLTGGDHSVSRKSLEHPVPVPSYFSLRRYPCTCIYECFCFAHSFPKDVLSVMILLFSRVSSTMSF